MPELAPLIPLTVAALAWLIERIRRDLRPWPLHELAGEAAGVDLTPDAAPEPPAWHDTLMAKKGGGSAPDPDPNIGRAALKNAELGEEWLAFAEEQFDYANERQTKLDEMTERVTEQQLATQDRANEWAAEDRERWEETFKPLQDEYIDKAANWDSEARQGEMAAEAKADVMSNAAAQRGASERNMASMGVDPRSGRYAAVDKAGEVNTALAAAGAQNNARQQVRKEGMSLQADALNIGAGLPSQAASGASLGLNAGNSALAGQTGANSMALNNTSIMSQGFQGAMSGNSSMAGILNSQYGNEVNAWSAQKQAEGQSAAALGQAAGSAAGMAMMMSSKDYKEGKQPAGDAMEKIEQMPVEEWQYKQGAPGDDGGQRHIGPYAEDYQRATGKGDGKAIPMQDMIGLQTKAIQEVGLRLDKLENGSPARGGKKRRQTRPAKGGN